ncbi:MAG: FeoA family protein [Flavobacteriaceae bacterium]|nr:FeoA family protein [Flavobacteriaceae bacterium]
MCTVANMLVGEKGIITDLSLDHVPLNLLEMGCLPGNELELVQLAPLKDPLYLRIDHTYLAIRKETAIHIEITKI